MSQDIRSFFTTLSKKNGTKTSTPAPKKPRKIPVSDDEDVITESPVVQKKETKPNKRKPNPFDSDSDTEKPSSTSKKPKPKQDLKPVNVKDLFGNEPVKQSYVEKKKSKKDEDFEKTLQQLDDDLPIDISDLDKTIDEAIRETKTPKKTKNGTPNRKRKAETDLNDSGLDPDQERFEKRQHSALLYKQYMNRSGPVNKGLKELPKGKPNCLQNLCFLRTGVLDSLEGEDFENLVKEHGGRTVHAVSKKVNYLVVGVEPGPAKLAKAQSYGIKEISEDDLLDMILVKSGMEPRYVKQDEIEAPQPKEEKDKKSPKVKEEVKSQKVKEEIKSQKVKEELKSPKKNGKSDSVKTSKSPKGDSVKNEVKVKSEPKTPNKKKDVKTEPETTKHNKHPKLSHAEDLKPIERVKADIPNDSKSWTEKYKPTNLKSIIGQQGDSSNMKKLMKWLKSWYQNHSGKNKPKLVKPSPWAKNDDGSFFKCALLSGPPGVGKTTTATLVAQELGFDVVDFNASDTRSKKLLHEEVSQLLSTKSIATFLKDGSAPTMKHVLLMDEVDGMAGNEDRGGIQELIGLIKNTNVPIICMCNDRQHQKMRSLVNHCYDLRFSKPRVEQIRGALMSICYKEGIDINPETLSEVIKAAGMDIRQSLNNLSMWTASDKKLTSAVAEKESNSAKKDTIIGPWEVIRKVFSEEEHKSMTLVDKSKLFFYDYSIGPLFVQENYLQVVPHCEKKDILFRVAKTADSISMGDLIDKKIRSTNNWSLLESQAMFSSVFPGHYMEGHFAGQINFPGWLGKNSKRTKFQRLTSELQAHMRTSISGSKQAVNLDYIYHLRRRIVNPLRDEGTNGVKEALEVMQAYNLLREDLDSILELALWPKKRDPMALVDSKVKSAFTRAYNKEGPLLPYAINSATVKKKTSSKESEMYGEEEGEESEENEDDDDITKDAMIKAKKKPTASTSAKVKKQVGETSKKALAKAKVKKPK